MKAVSEFDVPESCELCKLKVGIACHAFETVTPKVFWKNERAPFCPLKIVSDDAPTVDAVPVVRGEWVERITATDITCRRIECSNCGRTVIVSNNVPYSEWIRDKNWCQKCGAKMENIEGDRERV